MSSRGVNKWIGIGNCCADPDTKHLPSGSAVTNITIACGDGYKDKKTGDFVDTTEFVRVVFFNRLAEIAGEYLRKGGKVYIEGSLRTRKWQGQDGQDRYTTEIVANDMQMLDSRPADGAKPQAQPARTPPPPQQQSSHAPPPAMDSFEDSIPFIDPYKFTATMV